MKRERWEGGGEKRVERGKSRRARIVDVHFDCKKPPDQMTD